MKTNRGFELNHFADDYGVDCSLQESSSAEPHIWLGVHNPEIKIMYKDAIKYGMALQKCHPETNEYGWCDIPIPPEALIKSRMHLNKKQAKELAKELLYFSRTGRLKEHKI